jgi:hypothetical protein
VTVEAQVRDYLRGQDSVMDLLNTDPLRLNMEWKGNMSATHVTLYRAGGAAHEYYPHHFPALAIHCYGSTRPAAAEVADAIALALRRVTQADSPLLSAAVESVNWLPTTDGVARYIVTTVVTAQLADATA